jgi:hypothetical protein
MTIADLTYGLFTVFNGLRIFSYLPQILRVARDPNGASAISYATWSLWTAANATTGLYAAVNLSDPPLVVLNFVNAACCLAVIGLTVLKRRRLQPIAGRTAGHFSETA